MIEKIVTWLVERKVIDNAESDIYTYGLECLLLKCLHYISYFIIAIILHLPLELIVIGIVFTAIRSNSGGLHMNSRLGCYIFSCVYVFCILIFYSNIKEPHIYVCFLIMSNIILLFLSPIEHHNRPLDEDEKKKFKKKTVMYAGVVQVVVLIMYLNNQYNLSYLGIIGLFAASLLVFCGKIQYYIKNKFFPI